MGFAMGISCFASLLRAVFFSLLLFVSYFKWFMSVSVSVLLFTVHNHIYLVSSPSHSHLLSPSITINNFDPICEQFHMVVFFCVFVIAYTHA